MRWDRFGTSGNIARSATICGGPDRNGVRNILHALREEFFSDCHNHRFRHVSLRLIGQGDEGRGSGGASRCRGGRGSGVRARGYQRSAGTAENQLSQGVAGRWRYCRNRCQEIVVKRPPANCAIQQREIP